VFDTVVRCKIRRRKLMEKSVDQARWLLASVFAVAITLMAIGIVLG